MTLPHVGADQTGTGTTAIRLIAVANTLFGILVVASLALVPERNAAVLTGGLAGFVVALLASLRGSRTGGSRWPPGTMALTNAVLGAFIVAAPLVRGETGPYAGVNAALGLLILISSLSGAAAARAVASSRARRRPGAGI